MLPGTLRAPYDVSSHVGQNGQHPWTWSAEALKALQICKPAARRGAHSSTCAAVLMRGRALRLIIKRFDAHAGDARRHAHLQLGTKRSGHPTMRNPGPGGRRRRTQRQPAHGGCSSRCPCVAADLASTLAVLRRQRCLHLSVFLLACGMWHAVGPNARFLPATRASMLSNRTCLAGSGTPSRTR
jgi:hypothetical protein